MFIETRFFDDGRAEARLCMTRPSTDTGTDHDGYDYYVDEADDLREWISESLYIEPDDIVPLVIALEAGDWTSITDYV